MQKFWRQAIRFDLIRNESSGSTATYSLENYSRRYLNLGANMHPIAQKNATNSRKFTSLKSWIKWILWILWIRENIVQCTYSKNNLFVNIWPKKRMKIRFIQLKPEYGLSLSTIWTIFAPRFKHTKRTLNIENEREGTREQERTLEQQQHYHHRSTMPKLCLWTNIDENRLLLPIFHFHPIH